MGNAKQATDSTAKDYWESYFGDYGRELVRKILKRIARSVVADLKRLAAKTPDAPPLQVSGVSIAPLGRTAARTETGGRIFEGVLQAKVTRNGRPENAIYAFSAELSVSGDLVNLTSRRAPTA